MHHDELEDHDLGLAADLPTLVERRLVDRRLALGLFAGAGLAALVGCGSSDTPRTAATSASSQASAAAAADTACAEIPAETAGPYPGDGSNGPNVLTQSGIVRSDITKSFGTATGVAVGIPTTVRLTIQDVSKSCAARAGAALYLWHCNIDGEYSMYSRGIANENYLRGVQESDSTGLVTFKTIFPACYSGRWPHMHFEVYPSLTAATTASGRLRTSQLALPKDVCDTVYATQAYSASADNLARVSLQTDNVFRDGYQQEMATVTGSVSDGYVVSLTLAV